MIILSLLINFGVSAHAEDFKQLASCGNYLSPKGMYVLQVKKTEDQPDFRGYFVHESFAPYTPEYMPSKISFARNGNVCVINIDDNQGGKRFEYNGEHGTLTRVDSGAKEEHEKKCGFSKVFSDTITGCKMKLPLDGKATAKAE